MIKIINYKLELKGFPKSLGALSIMLFALFRLETIKSIATRTSGYIKVPSDRIQLLWEVFQFPD